MEQDFELVIVNDGSSDKSGAILSRFARKHPDKIKVHIVNLLIRAHKTHKQPI